LQIPRWTNAQTGFFQTRREYINYSFTLETWWKNLLFRKFLRRGLPKASQGVPSARVGRFARGVALPRGWLRRLLQSRREMFQGWEEKSSKASFYLLGKSLPP